MGIIIQLSGWKGSGKDTLADYLVERLPNCKTYSYANYLKNIFCEKFKMTREEMELYKRNEDVYFDSIKEAYPDLESPNVRMGLIRISAELKKNHGNDCFINVVKAHIETCSDMQYHIITDMRFENEMNLFPDALLVRINRECCKSDLPMENNLNDSKFDLYLDNNSTLDLFYKECDVLIDLIK